MSGALPSVAEYAIAASLGGGVGLAELLTRYRDSPRRLAKLLSTWFYAGGNAGAAALALLGMHAGQVTLGNDVTTALAAGAGSMAILRSALGNVRVGDRDVPAGPAAFITGILNAVERVIDRNQAKIRSTTVGEIMDGLSFEHCKVALVEHCFYLLEGTTPDEGARLAQETARIADSDCSDSVKVKNLGVVLINFAGEEVLRGAVTTLGQDLKASSGEEPPAVTRRRLAVTSDRKAGRAEDVPPLQVRMADDPKVER